MSTIEDVLPLTQQPESETLEFKKSHGLDKEIAKTASAMANGGGGVILVGVRNDGKIVGFPYTEDTQKALRRGFPKVDPELPCQVDYVPLDDGSTVAVLRVQGSNTPKFFYDGKMYRRVGPETRQMPLAMMKAALVMGSDWESEPAQGVEAADLDEGRMARIIQGEIELGHLGPGALGGPETMLTGLGLVSRDGSITNAGALLFGRPNLLQARLPQAHIRLARFKGSSKAEMIDSRQVVGNVFDVYEAAESFLKSHVRLSGRIAEGEAERVDDQEYPWVAIRESLVNAVCHRDYSQSFGSVSVAVFDDEIEIRSPGGLVAGLTVEMLKKRHDSKPRNPRIAFVLHRARLVEKWGGGIEKILEAVREAGLPEPGFSSSEADFVVKLRKALDGTEGRILRLLSEESPLSNADIQGRLELARTTVTQNLAGLRERGLIRLEGTGRGARWHYVS